MAKISESFLSRKFVFSFVTSALISILGILSADYAGMQGVYPTIVGGLLGSMALYLGGNVSSKFVNAKTRNIPIDNLPDKEDKLKKKKGKAKEEVIEDEDIEEIDEDAAC